MFITMGAVFLTTWWPQNAMQMNQAVTFLSDGGDTFRDLQMYVEPVQKMLGLRIQDVRLAVM
jgi:hypothetical protein